MNLQTHAPIYVYMLHTFLSILSAEDLAHTMTLRTRQILAPLHLLPLLHFAARVLQPPDAGIVGLLGDGKMQVKRSFTKYSGIFHIYIYTITHEKRQSGNT